MDRGPGPGGGDAGFHLWRRTGGFLHGCFILQWEDQLKLARFIYRDLDVGLWTEEASSVVGGLWWRIGNQIREAVGRSRLEGMLLDLKMILLDLGVFLLDLRMVDMGLLLDFDDGGRFELCSGVFWVCAIKDGAWP